MQYLRADTITEVVIGPCVAVGDGFTPVTTMTIAACDEAYIIKHGSTSDTAIVGTVAVFTNADGYYTLDLSATDTNTEGRLTLQLNDDSLMLPIRMEFMVMKAQVFDSFFTVSTDILDVQVVGIDSAAVTSTAIATDAITSTGLAASAANEVRDTILSDATTFPGASVTEARLAQLDAATPGAMANDVSQLVDLYITTTGIAQSVTASTIQLASAETFADDELNGQMVIVYSATTGAGQARYITNYVSSTDTATIAPDWSVTPTGGSIRYAITGAIAQILTDFTPFVGANIDAAITTRATPTEVATELATYDGPTEAEMNLRTILSADYFDPAADTVVNVTNCANNADMVGTDAAALATVCTELRLAELDPANLPTDIAAIPTVMVGTDDAALATVCTEARLSELDAGTGGKMANQMDIVQTDTTTDIPATITTLQSDTDDIQTRLPAALVGGAMDSDVSIIQTAAAQTVRDAILPTQNIAFNNMEFLFVAASDHVTPVTGAGTMAVTRSIDGGAFGAGTGTGPAEVGNGIYQYDASAADMNGGIITFRFTATSGTPGAPDDVFVTVVTGGGV